MKSINFSKIFRYGLRSAVFCKHRVSKLLVVYSLLFFATALAVAHGQPSTNRSVSITLPNDVLIQLQQQATALKTISLLCTEKYDSSAAYDGPISNLICFATNCFYSRQECLQFVAPGKSELDIHEDSFDGKFYYFGNPALTGFANPAVLAKYQVNDSSDPDYERELFDTSYLDKAGIFAPKSLEAMNDFQYLEPQVLHILGTTDPVKVSTNGKSLEISFLVDDGAISEAKRIDIKKQKTVLEARPHTEQSVATELDRLKKLQGMPTKHQVTFILDPQYGFATVGRKIFDPIGIESTDVECSEWRHYDGANIWLPSQCVSKVYADAYAAPMNRHEVGSTVTYELMDISFTVPDNVKFQLSYTNPGSSIRDRTDALARRSATHETVYTVAASGALLKESADHVWANMGLRKKAVTIAIMCVLMVAPAMVPLVRHFKNRK